MNAPAVSDVRFTPAPPGDTRRGVQGWIACRAGGLALDGIVVLGGTDAALRLRWPSRRDGAGRRHPYALPADPEQRRALERQILDAVRPMLQAPPGARQARPRTRRRGPWRRRARRVR